MNNKRRDIFICKSKIGLFLPSVMLLFNFSNYSNAETSDDTIQELDEIIVSARRQEESAQEIPISMTVLSQETLENNNIVGSADLKQVTPSLSVNNRLGPDQATFALRGFTQELRTTASVGVYFAEVVAPRGGGGSTNAGDGAGPGSFFDLQNVVVLKGPQGTLFGRNTTGGAILLTPKEPTDEFGGYVEGSAGNYAMHRTQAVLNIPMGEKVRTRLGIDSMKRDGYINNQSGIGSDEMANTDYTAARLSTIFDINDSLENYTILSYMNSENNGVPASLFACRSGFGLYNAGCDQQLSHQGDDFYSVESNIENPSSKLKQWQAINKTTWSVSDDFTVKNILSYAGLEQTGHYAVFGINYDYYGLGRANFAEVNGPSGLPANSQISYVEEFQLQGYALDDELTWQVGLYFEKSKPDGVSGTVNSGRLACSYLSYDDPGSSLCVDYSRNALYQQFGSDLLGDLLPYGFGTIQLNEGEVEFTNKAIYSEATYDINDSWKTTMGLRYTRDEAESHTVSKIWNSYPYVSDPGTPATPGVAGHFDCIYTTTSLGEGCKDHLDQTSEAVTGLAGIEYTLSQNVMTYAKYSRGYRMGSLNPFGGEAFRKFEPEHVNTYEIGAKTTFRGSISGMVNIAVFYNELQDQQLQYAYVGGSGATTVIVNAGSSHIQGAELEALLSLTNNLKFNLSYTYLETRVDKIKEPTLPAGANAVPSAIEGEELTYSPKDSIVAGLNYLIPVSEDAGIVSVGLTWSYTGEQNSTSSTSTPYARLDSYEIVNLNANWYSIMQSNFDSSLFVANALDEKYTAFVSGTYGASDSAAPVGFETRQVGVPKMWGGRIRYNFD